MWALIESMTIIILFCKRSLRGQLSKIQVVLDGARVLMVVSQGKNWVQFLSPSRWKCNSAPRLSCHCIGNPQVTMGAEYRSMFGS